MCDIGLGLAGRGLRTEASHLATTQTLPEREADIKRESGGISLVAQWLRLCLPMQGLWVRSLVRQLRSHIPGGQKTKTKQKQYCNKFNINFLKRESRAPGWKCHTPLKPASPENLGLSTHRNLQLEKPKKGFPSGSVMKNPSVIQEPQKTWAQPLGWEVSPRGGHGNPLPYSCLENPMDRKRNLAGYSSEGCRVRQD